MGKLMAGLATVALALVASAGVAAAQSDPPGDEPPPDDGSLLGPDPGGPGDEPPPPPDVEPAMDPEVAKAAARKLLEGGDEFFKKGDYYVKRKKPKEARERYERALAAYSKAFELAGSAQINYPMALAEEKLERWLDAAIHYRRFLVDASDADSGLRDKATARLDAIKMQIGVLVLMVQPEGAAVAIDDATIGAAPLAEAIFLAPGDHTLAITADGYQPAEHKFTVEAGSEAERTYELEPVPAVIVDEVRPPPPPPPPPRLPSGPSKLPMILGGGVTLGLVGGAVATGLMATGRHDIFADASASANRRENARTEGKSLALTTDLLLAGAVVAGAVTTYYYLKVYKPKVRAHERRNEARRAGGGFAGVGGAGPKVLVVPWVEASGTAAGLSLGGSL